MNKIIYRSEEKSKILTLEKEKLIRESTIETARIFIKFFNNPKYANDLLEGKFFCNTPAYYRKSNMEGVGDTQESVAYSGTYDPNYRIDNISLKKLVKLSDLPVPENELKELTVSLFPEQFKHGWLHCWFVIDEVTDLEFVAQLAADLIRVQKEFGLNYVFFTSNDFHEMTKRLADKLDRPVGTARIAYTDNNYFHNIACKRLEYKYQREFRFILEECEINETNPKIYCLGDMRDILKFNKPVKILSNGAEKLFELSEHSVYMNPKYFKPNNGAFESPRT